MHVYTETHTHTHKNSNTENMQQNSLQRSWVYLCAHLQDARMASLVSVHADKRAI